MKNKKQRVVIPIILIFAVVIVYCIVKGRAWESKDIIFNEHLSDQVLNVDGNDLTLQDLAFYIAWQELAVEKEARIYSPENPNQYWNMHTNGIFVKVAAKQHVIDMAVHDEIFSRAAKQERIELDEEEKKALKNAQDDFWYDLTEEQRNLLGVERDVLDGAMYRIALAEKYQVWMEEQTNIHYESFRTDGTAYKEMILPEHQFEINKKLWDKVKFGNIIVPHNVESEGDKTDEIESE